MGAMRVLPALVAIAWLGAVGVAAAADPLAEARRLYNEGDYESAAGHAREALKVPGMTESARLVLGRVCLELYRRSADHTDLIEARNALRSLDAQALDERERAELLVGLGEYLFLEDRYGVASESFERALDSSRVLGASAHERVLDWWATSLDRLALASPPEIRDAVYARIVSRMESEIGRTPGSSAAAYWLAAGLRGAGQLDRAWNAARAGWITAMLASDRGAALRADLDRLMLQGIIPDRAMRLQPEDSSVADAVMRSEWAALKAAWTR
jgi:tetratricopeptide (TPR) repeat protein